MNSKPQTLLLEAQLKKLRLPTFYKYYQELSRQAEKGNFTYEQFLPALVEQEVQTREENTRKQRIRQAGFPTPKLLEQFDFTVLPTLNKPLVLKLAQGEYLSKQENVVLLGNSGTGKTHLAIALGMEACKQSKRVLFFTAAELINTLLEAQAQYRLSRVEHRLESQDLLIIDELGYLPLEEKGAKLLFSVFAQRYERGSMIVTSNLPFENWDTIFQDAAMSAALLDRLTHHCHILEINGESYRFKESRKTKSI
jgi:DNA replication protein DnaC